MPSPFRVGLNPLAIRLITLHAIILAFCVATYARLGLSVVWSPSSTVGFLGLGLLIAFWLHHYLLPGSATERLIAETIFILILVTSLTITVFLAEYAAVALKRPYADASLAAADAWMGVSVVALARWTGEHATFSTVMSLTYLTFAPQLLMTFVVLAACRDREGLWEFAFHFHLCLTMALLGLAIWPAICAPEYYGFQSTMDESHLIAQIKGFHDGTLRVIRFDDVNGLVSFPSFHVAGGLFAMWALRRYRWIISALAVINVFMFASTFMSGLHYAVDAVGAVPTFLASLTLYRWWGRPLLTGRSRMSP